MKFFYSSVRPHLLLTLCLAMVLQVVALPVVAEEEAAEEPEPLWQSTVGLSFLATSGNSETSSLGLKLEAARRKTPWGFETKLLADRAEENSQETAERYFAGFRVTRDWEAKPELFLGASFEQDEFSGIELRTLVEAGLVLVAKDTETDHLHFDIGVTWTDENRVQPELDDSGLGAILGLRWERTINEHATFVQALTCFPSFDDSDDWRLESLTALTAALTDRFAVQLGYEVRYRNMPVGDRDDTDTSAKASLVWKL